MTSNHPFPSRPLLVRTLLTAVLAATCGAASAQTYTAKVLPNPLTTTGCQGASAYLDDQGNVQGHCYVKQTDLGVLWFAFLSGGRANDVEKTVVWRASGATQILNTYALGFNTAAQAISSAPTNADYMRQGVYSYWNGLTRNTVKSVPDLGGTWILLERDTKAVSRGGRAMILTPPITTTDVAYVPPLRAVLRDGVATVLPAAPTACEPRIAGMRTEMRHAINDAGQVATLAVNKPEASGIGPDVKVRHQPCLWDGRTWTVAPTLPHVSSEDSDRGDYELEYRSQQKLDLSDTGELLLHSLRDTAFLWKAGAAALTPVDSRVRQFGGNGGWIGGALPSDVTRDQPALAWQQGAPVDLNTITTGIPSDMSLMAAVSANKKGQILAVGVPKRGAFYRERVRLVLLTPR